MLNLPRASYATTTGGAVHSHRALGHRTGGAYFVDLFLPRTRVNKEMLVGRLPLRSGIGAQPQRGVLGLYCCPYHPHQIVVEGVQVRFVAQPGVEGCQSTCRIVLPSVEAPVYERLDAPSQRVEQGGDQESGGDERQGELLPREDVQGGLQANHTPEVHQRQHRGERCVDQRG